MTTKKIKCRPRTRIRSAAGSIIELCSSNNPAPWSKITPRCIVYDEVDYIQDDVHVGHIVTEWNFPLDKRL